MTSAAQRGSTRRRFLVLAAAAVLLIGALGLALYRSTRQADASHLLVLRAEQVLETLASLREQLALMESSQRGFLLLEQERFLHDRDSAITGFRHGLGDLRTMLGDDPLQLARHQQLAEAFELRVALVEQTVERARSLGIEAARSFFGSGAPQRANQRIRAIAEEMREHETALLGARREAELQGRRATRMVLAAVGLAGALLLLPAAASLLRQQRAREEAERRLLAVAGGLPGTIFQLEIDGGGEQRWTYLPGVAPWPAGRESGGSFIDAAPALDEMPADDRQRLGDTARRAHAEGTAFELDFRVPAADGTQRWIRATAALTESSRRGRVWTGYWADITESKRAEQQLRETSERLEKAQHLARIGDWTYDLLSGANHWSPAVYPLLLRDPALGEPSFEESLAMFLDDGAETVREHFQWAAESGLTQRFELKIRSDESSVRHLEVIAIPGRDGDGRVVRLSGTIQDVTERQQLAQRLLEAKEAADAANRAKGVFLATMSHEIRTPMYGIVGLLELLALTPLSADQRETLAIIRDSGRALQRIIDDILDFSRIEAGRLEIVPEATSLSRIVDGLHRSYSGSASARGLVLDGQCDPRIAPALWVDGVRLRQILGNFVSNALKFTERGRVEIRAELVESSDSEQRVRVSVRDTGVGMTEEQQRAVLEPFVQVGSSGAAREGGTGLGLAICTRLAELMGASLRMDSKVGVGTTMALELTMAVVSPDLLAQSGADPVEQARSAAFPPDRVPPSPGAAELAGTLVLVVDDHPINRLVLRSQLTRLGYASQIAEHGEQALALFRSHRFGLVITDCNMPEMSGYELARAIRDAEAAEGRPRTTILACTANVLGGEIQRCLDAGMDDYLAKPTGLAQLSERLKRWLPAPGPEPAAPAAGSDVPPDAEQAHPLDLPTLRALAKTLDADERQLFAHYRQLNAVDAQALREAADRGDLAGVVRFAHRMRGAGALIGAEPLARACATLEEAGRRGDQVALGEGMRRIESEFDRLQTLSIDPDPAGDDRAPDEDREPA